MRLLSALLFLLFLCLCGPLRGTEAKKEESAGDETQPARRGGRNRAAVPGAGELTSKEGHRCKWETAAEEGGAVALQVTCSHGELSYRCRYAGQPDLCPAYAARSGQYWKQVAGKLRKKKNACDGDKVLKTRVCKKAPAESHMTLDAAAEEEEEERAVEEVEAKKKRGKGGGEKKEAESKGAEKKEKKEKKEEEEKEKPKPPAAQEGGAFGEVNDGNMETEPAEGYCAEGWQSFCSFFVKFIDG